jgi:hypothetical protein
LWIQIWQGQIQLSIFYLNANAEPLSLRCPDIKGEQEAPREQSKAASSFSSISQVNLRNHKTAHIFKLTSKTFHDECSYKGNNFCHFFKH